jgi:hypothetical protein
MADIAIGRLRVRGPPGQAARAAFLIEDACRTEIPDSERLILVRRLDLGRSRARRADQAASLRRAYDMATLGARHGGDSMAASANCVWFASRAEARRLLLAFLLAGRAPSGWYWRLAVPDWRGQNAEQWLADLVAPALKGGGEPDLAEIVALAVEAKAVETLLRVLAGPAGAFPSPLARLEALENPSAPGAGRGSGPEPHASYDRGGAPAAVLRLRARLAPAFAASVEAVIRRIGAGSRASDALLERLLLTASPSLALSPALLRDLIRAYGDHVAAPGSVPAYVPPEAAVPRRHADAPARDATMPEEQAPMPAPAQAAAAEAGVLPPPGEAPAPPLAEVRPAESPPLRALEEMRSPAAGLWLVLPALIRMGFREWLIARPETLCDDPGRALLRAVALHHRVTPDDAALRPLGPDEAEPPEWTRLWRVGLDRWLRRRARVPLARLVWRPGWVRQTEDRLTIRFPPQAADIRLRRHALDVDPGWTDWLGLSVRYAFAERASP